MAVLIMPFLSCVILGAFADFEARTQSSFDAMELPLTTGPVLRAMVGMLVKMCLSNSSNKFITTTDK